MLVAGTVLQSICHNKHNDQYKRIRQTKKTSRESSGFNHQIMTQDSDFDSVVYGYYNEMYVLNCN